MNREYYREIIYSKNKSAYLFLSEGMKGNINKVVIFQPLNEYETFNLVLGDLDEQGVVSDKSISDNGDMPKILATVVHITLDFFKKHPLALVLIEGNSPIKTYLYWRVIREHYTYLANYFHIQFEVGNEAYKTEFVEFNILLRPISFKIKKNN